MSIKKSDKSLCRTWYENTHGCPSTTQDRDNAEGGTNGPETVTLQDSGVNSLYTYLIAIQDYEFENTGLDLLSSGAGISLTNELNTVEHKMVATVVNMTNDYYLFGCVHVQENGEFTYTPAQDTVYLHTRTRYSLPTHPHQMGHFSTGRMMSIGSQCIQLTARIMEYSIRCLDLTMQFFITFFFVFIYFQ